MTNFVVLSSRKNRCCQEDSVKNTSKNVMRYPKKLMPSNNKLPDKIVHFIFIYLF